MLIVINQIQVIQSGRKLEIIGFKLNPDSGEMKNQWTREDLEKAGDKQLFVNRERG